MTDKQRLALLRKGVRELKLTTGYDPLGGHWKKALADLRKLEDDLKPGPNPKRWQSIGGVTQGGRSLLDMSLTHQTHGLPLFPAIDLAWGAGVDMFAPEDCVVDTKDTSAHPGEALYLRGTSGARYWVGHIDRDYPLGRKFDKGDFIGQTVPTTIGGGPHGHWGVNAEAFLGKGKQLKYGRDGNGPDYTLGAPTVREQLAKALA